MKTRKNAQNYSVYVGTKVTEITESSNARYATLILNFIRRAAKQTARIVMQYLGNKLYRIYIVYYSVHTRSYLLELVTWYFLSNEQRAELVLGVTCQFTLVN